MVYYNENNAFCAKWLKSLIEEGLLPSGEVDSRSIEDVSADDLNGFKQCHFFAGIGGWALALQLAGCENLDGIWTGSCPCQPFSIAGKKGGFDDERNLWGIWFNLIRKCKPSTVFGEQTSSGFGENWLDAISNDLEAEGFAVGSADLPASSVGAPHRRSRFYWCGWNLEALEHTLRLGLQRGVYRRQDTKGEVEYRQVGCDGSTFNTEGFWDKCDWVWCKDECWRPFESGNFPLVDGFPTRMAQLRAYGNAIVPKVAALFIKSAILYPTCIKTKEM